MRAQRRLAGVALALVAAGAQPAQAANPPARATSAVVARDGKAALEVSDDKRDDLCLAIDVGGAVSRSCDEAEAGAVVIERTGRGGFLVGLAVPAGAASVEVRRAGRLIVAGPTVAGSAYEGKRAGTLRFALLRLPSGTAQDGLRVRALAAGGMPVGVLVAGDEPDLVVDRRRLLSGRAGAVRWSLVGRQLSALTSSVLDLDHESITRCVDTSVSVHKSSTQGSSTCEGTAPRDNLDLLGGAGAGVALQDRCSPGFRLIHGVVDAAVRRVVVLLGDGARRAARIAPVGNGRRLVYALVVPRLAAVRSVTLDRGPAGSETLAVAGAPLSVGCAMGGFDEPVGGTAGVGPGDPFGELPAVMPSGPVTTIAGSPAIRVADGPGDSLCVAVGEGPFTALGCAVVSPLLGEVAGSVDSLSDPHAFAIELPARVAAVRIAGPGGKGSRDIPTIPGDGYRGPYAGHVRFAAATVADGRELSRIDYLDAAGTVLYSERDEAGVDELPGPPKVASPRRIAGRAGRPSLWQTAVSYGGQTQRCLALTSGPPPAAQLACQSARTARSVLLDAPCTTHRLTVAVAVAARTRVFAKTRRGRVRAIVLHRGAGVLTLPSGTPLRALTFVRDTKRTRVCVDAPAGAHQCGWAASPMGGP